MGDGKDLPQIHDEQPPAWTGVPVERDPVTGRLLRGRAGGRNDKSRSASRPRFARLPLLIGAAVVLVVGATTATVAVLTGSDADTAASDEPGAADEDPGGATGGDPGEATGSEPGGADEEPPVETVRRPVPMEFTVTAIRTPPGQEGRYGSVGETHAAIWQITGPCDGVGSCAVEECIDDNRCVFEFTLSPAGSGYTGQYEFSWFGNPWPECGAVRVAVEVTVSQGADGPAFTGTYTQSHGPPLGYDGNVGHCDIALTDFSFRSV